MFMRNYSVARLLSFSFSSDASEKSPDLGQPASVSQIKRWNTDVFPNGYGLPKGLGTAVAGEKIYKKHCIACHGLDGTGDSADELAGAGHSLTDNPPDKIIGTYWPYATTIFDFTKRSMPLNAPGILGHDELYAVTAYLLYLNDIIEKDSVMNAKTLPQVNMPNKDGFINIYQQEKKHKR
jgi:cytochrome c